MTLIDALKFWALPSACLVMFVALVWLVITLYFLMRELDDK